MTTILYSYHNAETPDDMPRDFVGECCEADCTSEPVCATCGLSAPYWIFEDCLECASSYTAAHPYPWSENRKWYASTPECAAFERKVAEKVESLAMFARAIA